MGAAYTLSYPLRPRSARPPPPLRGRGRDSSFSLESLVRLQGIETLFVGLRVRCITSNASVPSPRSKIQDPASYPAMESNHRFLCVKQVLSH